MWLLPSHKRPEKLMRFIRSMSLEDLQEPILLSLWENDPRLQEYMKLELPHTWAIRIGPERWCGSKMNWAFNEFPDDNYYGLLTDDIELSTRGMLPYLRTLAMSEKFVWPDDGIWNGKLATHPVAPGDMIRAMGFWAHERFPHNHIDSVLFIIASELGILQYCPECQIKVTHPAFGTAELDETYLDAQAVNSQAVDEYARFVAQDLYPLVKKTKEVYYGERKHSNAGSRSDETLFAHRLRQQCQ